MRLDRLDRLTGDDEEDILAPLAGQRTKKLSPKETNTKGDKRPT
jgi:hypothetical protein